MTGEALRVVKGYFLLQLVMRIMTYDATDPVIDFVVPRTIEDPVSLKADIINQL